MHPSIRILKLSGTGKMQSAGAYSGFLEEGEHMLERLLLPDTHAIAILVKDHDRVKDLFDRFEKEDSGSGKEKIIREALTELKIHAAIEEEIFYPAVRRQLGKDVMNEADEEHHVARVLIAELDRDGRGDDHRDAKFTVLAESVRHHIKEEEGEMLPKAKGLEIDFEALGQQMLARKKELRRDGIPPDAEHKMVAAANGRGDSPAARARRGSKAPAVSARRTRSVVREAGRRSGGGTKAKRRRPAA
jgi:hemerythrin superfamily protein